MATAIATPKTTPTENLQHYLRIALDRIEPDPEQPRKTFDDQALSELAESIVLHDVIVPIDVRPHPKKGDGWYMLIAGERRWRAARIAGKKDIAAIVNEAKLTAAEVLERQLLENSQREDVPPIEEAEAYSKLLKLPGYSMDLLIAKTGKSKAHLYGRLKLLELAPGARKALESGKLAPAIAEAIGRLPDKKLQEDACRDVLGLGDHNAYRGAGVQFEEIEIAKEGGDTVDQRQPLSYRAAIALIRRKYQTKLSIASFHPDDATLLPQVGACTTCPHRSFNQPALPGLNGTASSEDFCTNAKCFESKTHANWKRRAEEAKAKGIEVLDQKKAKDLFGWNGELQSTESSRVCSPDDELPYTLRRPGSNGTFAKLLGKEIANVPKILVQDPSGAAREVLDQGAAIKKLRELGKIDDGRKKSSPSEREAKKEQAKARERDEAKRELNELAVVRLLEQVATGAAKDLPSKETAIWRWLGLAVIDLVNQNYVDVDLMLNRRGFKDGGVAKAIESAKTVGDIRSLIAELLMNSYACQKHGVWGHADKDTKELYESGLKLFGGDWDKATALAKEALKAETAAAAAKKKPASDDGKRCGVVGGKSGNGCIHDQGHEGAHSDGKRTWSNKPAKKGGKK